MAEIDGGKLIVDALVREGVNFIFSLSGGHLNPVYKAAVEAGIRVIDTRREQADKHRQDRDQEFGPQTE